MHVQNDRLLLADVFENFRKMCLEIYELDPPCFITALRLPWQGDLKKTKVKIDLLTDTYVLLTLIKLGFLKVVFSGVSV